MGTGTDVAMETAGITLMRSDPGLVPAAISVSRATWNKIRKNLFWAFIYNIVLIPLAAGVLAHGRGYETAVYALTISERSLVVDLHAGDRRHGVGIHEAVEAGRQLGWDLGRRISDELDHVATCSL